MSYSQVTHIGDVNHKPTQKDVDIGSPNAKSTCSGINLTWE
jgi:hypothetical protein